MAVTWRRAEGEALSSETMGGSMSWRSFSRTLGLRDAMGDQCLLLGIGELKEREREGGEEEVEGIDLFFKGLARMAGGKREPGGCVRFWWREARGFKRKLEDGLYNGQKRFAKARCEFREKRPMTILSSWLRDMTRWVGPKFNGLKWITLSY